MHGSLSAAVWVAAIAATLGPASAVPQQARVKAIFNLPSTGGNGYYRGNRAPLLPSPLIKLPVGAVRPAGWLRSQINLETEGFSGRLTDISPWCKQSDSAWATPEGKGKNGWEELPYWLKGYVSLGYVSGNKRVTSEAKRWISGIISTRRASGYFGPESNLASCDLWPNMPALYALRTEYEATHDRAIIDLMLRYFRWINQLPIEKYLPDSWQKMRGGDNLEIIYWLYNETGQPWLLDLARLNHERTADWTGGIASEHGVNFAQCFREPAVYYQQTRDRKYLRAAERNYDTYRRNYGQVPGGLYGADENARAGYTGPRQAAETCAMVEMMYSHEVLAAITGDATWADRCEEIAFNSLPASMTPDLKGLHYLTAPNMVQLDRASKSPMIQNGGDMLSYNPYDFRCCQHNAAMGWPYFTEHLWMATQGNGLAAVLYAPGEVTAKVGAAGSTVTIREDTGYPFDDRITLTIGTHHPVRFPLYLRIPGWCATPSVQLDGHAVAIPAHPRGWLEIDREWKPGDRLVLTLPMAVRLQQWKNNRNTVSVARGPLTYSLKIGERWQRWGGTDTWPAFEVFPTSPWNYGLAIDPASGATSITVHKTAGAMASQPFAPDAAPITLQVAARRIPEWTQETNGLVGEVQPGPLRSDQPVETVTLIPMGAARLRISAFPLTTTNPNAPTWGEQAYEASASHTNATDCVAALHDGIVSTTSQGVGIPRFTWWNHLGTTEWVEYTYAKPHTIGSCQVYWFDDEATGGQCRVPASWRVLYWDGAAWNEVANASGYAFAKDTWNRVTFTKVTTTQIRIEVKLQPGFSGGILEWRADQ